MLLASIAALVSTSAANAAVSLGTAYGFAILAGSTVTNTGPSTIEGEVGVSTGSAITGFPPGIVSNGTFHSNDAVAILAKADAQLTYTALSTMAVTLDLTGQNLGGKTLTPGVYHFDSIAQLTGVLTLDGLGQVDPVFVFQVGSTLTTASASSILAINGANPSSGVFFQVGESATLGTGTSFVGTIISSASNTLETGASVEGRVISLTGAVTLDTNHVAIPEPACAVLLSAGLAAGVFRRRRTLR